MSKSQIAVGELPIEVTRKQNQKNMYVRINPPDGIVAVSAPTDISDEAISNFVLRKMPEIIKVRDRMLAQERQSRREYVSGESHYLWGKAYRLQVIYGGGQYKVEKTPNKIIMRVPEGTDEATRERVMTEWYRREIKRVLPSILQQCQDKIGVTANECKVKNMRTRWGTCNSKDKRIWINLQLVKKPIECLEYVMTHELVHLIEKNHTHRFHALVEQHFPGWRDARKLLTEMPLDYIESGEHETNE